MLLAEYLASSGLRGVLALKQLSVASENLKMLVEFLVMQCRRCDQICEQPGRDTRHRAPHLGSGEFIVDVLVAGQATSRADGAILQGSCSLGAFRCADLGHSLDLPGRQSRAKHKTSDGQE